MISLRLTVCKRQANVNSRHGKPLSAGGKALYLVPMMFWIISGLITLGVMAVLVSALRKRGDPSLTAAASDVAVYRDQLEEVDRDLARGALGAEDAEAARIEVSRRLLAADKRDNDDDQAAPGAFWPAAALIFALGVGGTVSLYVSYGAPGYPDQPMTARLSALEAARETRPDQTTAEAEAAPLLPKPAQPEQDYLDLVQRLRETVAEHPNDTRGLAFLHQHEAQLGNFAAARIAQETLVAAKGNDATIDDRQRLLDTMVFAAGGYVSPEAETTISTILSENPSFAPARYYQGLLYTQLGRPDLAFPIWRQLLEQSPPNAPWVPVIHAEIEQVAALAGVRYQAPEIRGPSAEDVAAAEDMTDEDRQAMIEGMVEGLAARLADEGGPPQDWARLISALGVLGQSDRANAIADEAETRFAGVAEALALIRQAREGLPE